MTQAPPSARPAVDTVLDRFEAWARDTPAARALVHGAEHLTYGELDVRANRLAHRLLGAGLAGNRRVAVATARPVERVVALLAVLKAGGAYCLIDSGSGPRTGRRRLTALSPHLLLADAPDRARLDEGAGPRAVDLGAGGIADLPPTAPDRLRDTPGAAVLFTGGSEARAVPVSQALLLAAYEGWAQLARPTPEDRHLFTGEADATAFAAGWTRALCSGGTLVLPETDVPSPQDLVRTVRDEEVSCLYTDPGGAGELLRQAPEPPPAPAGRGREPAPALHTVRLVAVTGDRFHLDEQIALQDRLRPGARVLAVYGLTEAAGTGTWFELTQLPRPQDDPETLAPLGTPFPGCQVHVLDGEIHLTPPTGTDPVATGDLGTLRPDGLLAFGGRLRDRLTLEGGRRLDPYAVESAIRTHPHIGAAVVARVTTAYRTRLVAYVAPPPEDPDWAVGREAVGLDSLREHLSGKVAYEELPGGLVRLRALPRNRAGQEDRAAVPQPPEPAKPKPRGTPSGGGKYGAAGGEGLSPGCATGCLSLPVAVLLAVLTGVFWPGSTDLTGVPQPWAFLFFVLYVFEVAAFAAGVVFLLGGRRLMPRRGRGRALTRAAHLAVAYLLLAWWPQDNFYRLAAKQDWPRQAALVYAFNIPLMIAGMVVAFYVTRKPSTPFDFDN
ncbi:AMP-binding protein [Streptomyces sp. NBC_00249]|uniref:AMP-binding protein n=1 Tax=Streptomyces sp. NBC_00249 TaxID=2975690 RepID=UPI0022521915|nr:AMP-binding protein [Streptomyces sp. NBC_00249]MCX5192678.1 AMP-binding protein [Streptomyces sp. NBC_00249]